MAKLIELLRHPDTRSGIPAPRVSVSRECESLWLSLRIAGDISTIDLPTSIDPLVRQSGGRRADRLWEHTCFECFVRVGGGAQYLELNFSPSLEWAAYRFNSYRSGMGNAELPAPAIVSTARPRRFDISARVNLPAYAKDEVWYLNLTAVIEETNGTKSYWALAHPPEGPPDFHHPDCFVLELPPATAA